MKILIVEWEDTASYGDKWMDRAEVLGKGTHSIVSVGVALSKSPEQLILIQSTSPCDGDCHNEIAISAGCITRIRELKCK